MGEVYRARDAKLNRDVAIKVLLPAVANDPDRLARFSREAQVLASLNHPNIAAIYGIEESSGVTALVMELVEGEDLSQRIARGPIPLDEALPLARQIAEALETAHEQGIIHRDLKPANIKVRADGTVKVLDFGLAKAFDPTGTSSANAMNSPTISMHATQAGIILGTAAYMSPEQARGKLVDKRTDIWAFGCVMYEMLTGRAAFGGAAITDILAAILEREPDWSRLPAATSANTWRLLQRCLDKDPKRRLHDIADARIELDDVLIGATALPALAPRPAARPSRTLLAWSVAGILLVILLTVAAALVRRPRESTWKNPLEGAQFSRLTDFEGTETDASISADGKFVVFLSDRDGRFDAWVTQLGTGDFKNLTGGLIPDLGNPVIRNLGLSGDSSKVWLAINDQKGGINNWTVPTLGGPMRPFLTSGVGAAWSTDGSRLVYHEYTAGDPMFVADRDGSNAKRIFIDQPGYHDHYLMWSPDGRYIYFVRGIPATRETDVWRLAASGGNPERITSHHNWVVSPTLIDNRTLLYSSVADDGSGPWLYAMDVEQRVPHRVSLGVEQYTSVSATVDGRRLVATVNNPAGHLWTLPILDHPAAESDASEVQLPNVRAVSPRYALDGFLYLSSGRSGDGLWKLEKGGSNELWRGTENGEISSPAVSSDGRVSFTLRKQGRGTLKVMTANGTGVHTLAETLDVSGVPSWSPDGRWIVVTADQGQVPSLFKVPLDGGAPVLLVNALASNPVWSPDGRLIVYAGPQISLGLPIKAVNPDGQSVPFPNLSLRIGGERHRFMPDGKGLVFVRGPWMKEAFYLLDLATGKERQLSDLKPGFTIRSFDVSPDGKQILFDRVRDNSDLVLIDLKVTP